MKKIDLIILPFHDYKKWLNEGFRTRDAHLFEHFKENSNINKILVINRPVSLGEVIIKQKKWKTETKDKEIYTEKNWRIVQIGRNSYYLDIFIKDVFKVILERKKWWNTAFNYKETIEIINRACDILQMENKCVFLENPMATGVIGNLNENLVAFDAIDNWLYHPQNSRYKTLIKENYDYIDLKSNIIFTVSDNLKSLFKNNKNINWVANGVDIEFFSTSVSTRKSIDKITIGYVGKIQDRIDFKLIEECLIRYKKMEFLFFGPILSCEKKVKYLSEKYSNIKFLGDIHYNNLPEEMKKIDIAIIPHLVNDFTNSMNPLKLYEYLAAGKQIVTTTIAGSENLSEYVYISDDYDEFFDNIDRAVEKYLNTCDLANDIIKNIDKEYFWKVKSEKIIGEILSLM